MRDIETRAFARGITVEDLMQSAAEAVADTVDDAALEPVLVLAGPGNNGGDGVVAAAILAERAHDVTVYSYRRSETAPFSGPSVRFEEDRDRVRLRDLLKGAGTIVDALLGIGQNRAPDNDLASLLRMVDEAAQPFAARIAVDVPTGVNSDSGAVPSLAFRADQTVSMEIAKLGTFLQPGARYAGAVSVVPIGIPDDLLAGITLSVSDPVEIARLLPVRENNANKGSSGWLEVIAGSSNFTGAPAMCSLAGYRAGAGLVEIATPTSAHPTVAAHVLEPIFRPLPETDGKVNPSAVGPVQEALKRARAVVLGPGLGFSDDTSGFVRAVISAIAESDLPAVVDADALNALSVSGDWWENAKNLILTPHPGEMSRLTGMSIPDIQADRIAVARDHAHRWNQVVVLKGAGTVVAAPDGRVSINTTGGPNLATAGTGDVLSGTIGGLLAQGLNPFDAAVAGVFLHGRAGDLLAEELGDVGTLASDVIGALPRARLSIIEEIEGEE